MFEFESIYQANTLKEAVWMLEQDPAQRIIAGGSDLLVKIRNRRHPGTRLLSIYKIEELRGIIYTTEGILIRPLTNFSCIANHPIILKHIPVLAEAAATVGGPQIRNMGTIGGNLCNGVPSADTASTLFALDAQLELTSAKQTRIIPIAEFYLGAGKVSIRENEILTGIYLNRASYEEYYGHFEKYSMRRAMDISTVNCSCNLKVSVERTKIEDFRLAFGVVAPMPKRIHPVEAAVRGMSPSKETVAYILSQLPSYLEPRDSWRASREFRIHILLNLTKNILFRLFREVNYGSCV